MVTCESQTELDRPAVVLQKEHLALQARRLGELVYNIGEMVEGVGEMLRVGRVAVAESRIVRHYEVGRFHRHELQLTKLTHDAGYTTAGPHLRHQLRLRLELGRESIYAWLGVTLTAAPSARETRIRFTVLAECYRASCCRYLWTKAIAMLPSPTAEATRLTGLNLTSPQAKTPGTLDSRR